DIFNLHKNVSLIVFFRGHVANLMTAQRRTTLDNGLRSVALSCERSIAIPALSVISKRDWRSRRESNPHLRFRKPPFYPLNYGNNDIFDFRFSIADCKQQKADGSLPVFLES